MMFVGRRMLPDSAQASFRQLKPRRGSLAGHERGWL